MERTTKDDKKKAAEEAANQAPEEQGKDKAPDAEQERKQLKESGYQEGRERLAPGKGKDEPKNDEAQQEQGPAEEQAKGAGKSKGDSAKPEAEKGSQKSKEEQRQQTLQRQQKSWQEILEAVRDYDGSLDEAVRIDDKLQEHVKRFYDEAKGPDAEYRQMMGRAIASKTGGDLQKFVKAWQVKLGERDPSSMQWSDDGVEVANLSPGVSVTAGENDTFPTNRIEQGLNASLLDGGLRIFEGAAQDKTYMQIEREMNFEQLPSVRARWRVEIEQAGEAESGEVDEVVVRVVDRKKGETVRTMSYEGEVEADRWVEDAAGSVGDIASATADAPA